MIFPAVPIRVLSSMEPEICTKMIRNLSEKLVAKFPATTLSYSMVKIARLDDAFSEIFELDVSPGKGQSLLQGDKRRQRKGEKNKFKKKTKSLKAQVTLLHIAREFYSIKLICTNLYTLFSRVKKAYTANQNGVQLFQVWKYKQSTIA